MLQVMAGKHASKSAGHCGNGAMTPHNPARQALSGQQPAAQPGRRHFAGGVEVVALPEVVDKSACVGCHFAGQRARGQGLGGEHGPEPADKLACLLATTEATGRFRWRPITSAISRVGTLSSADCGADHHTVPNLSAAWVAQPGRRSIGEQVARPEQPAKARSRARFHAGLATSQRMGI